MPRVRDVPLHAVSPGDYIHSTEHGFGHIDCFGMSNKRIYGVFRWAKPQHMPGAPTIPYTDTFMFLDECDYEYLGRPFIATLK